MTPTREELDALHGRMTAMTAYLDGSGAFPGSPFHYGERPAAEPAFWWRRGLSAYRETADALAAVSAELAAKDALLKEAADEIEAEVEAKRGTVLPRTTDRDLDIVRRIRAALKGADHGRG